MDFGLNPEQKQLRASVLEFARAQLNGDIDQRDAPGIFSLESWKKCADFGLLGLPMPVEYGGQGEGIISTIVAMDALGKGCRDNGLVFSINAQMWSCQMPILHYGSAAQKREWLPKLITGEALAAHAITEPNAGSDVFSLTARAEKVDGGYLINGAKTFSTNGPVADLAVAFAYVKPKTEGGAKQLTTFLVPRGAPGMTFGPPMSKMGIRTSPTGEVAFDDCFVPDSARLGAEGAGMRIFNSAMEWERACIFASHVGATERLLEDSIKYARERRQFGQPIAKYEAVANRIVEMKVAIDAGRLLVYYVGWMHEQGKNPVMESAIAKLFVGESHVQAAMDAVRIFGGFGYMKESPVERELRDSISGIIYSGTSDIQRRIIARCLGL
ncbi:MAG TPA: acyl-CoA dehydrogenase family protein [Candidatus Binataceae bacterium]|nr:acyl-CoA dehydrogenase family protein [Candidatus Binataceae bacterium]